MRCFAFMLLLVWPFVAHSQEILVRSGEHGAFTRLVLDIPSGTRWNLAPGLDQKVQALTLDRPGATFNLTTTFDKINRNRVASISPISSGGLAIEMACDCEIRAFLSGTTMLVLDVAPAEETAIGEPILKRTEDLPGLPDDALTAPGRISRQAPGFAVPFEPLQGATSLNGLADALALEIANGAAQGLLTPSFRAAAVPTMGPLLSADPETRMVPEDSLSREILEQELSSLLKSASKTGDVAFGGTGCTPKTALDIENWAANDDFTSAITLARNDLYGEFDRLDRTAALVMTRTLLYFGLGVEARSSLALNTDTKAPILTSLSYLVDGDEDPTNWFQGQIACPAPASMWAVLSQSGKTDLSDLETSALIRSFEDLPNHLQESLGLRLAERLAISGLEEAAQDILRRLKRKQNDENTSMSLTEAKIELAQGDLAGARQTLSSISDRRGSDAQRAVVASVAIARAMGERVPDQIVGLTEAFATELRDTPDGQEMWSTHQTALITNGLFDEAHSGLIDNNSANQPSRSKIADLFKKTLVEIADDVTFLKYALSEDIELLRDLDVALTKAYASRLIDLGLPDAALIRLDAIPDSDEDPNAKILMAKAELELLRPEAAEIRLIGLLGPEAAHLRAEARLQMGDNDYALAVFTELGDMEKAQTAALLSGNWDRMASAENPAIADAIRNLGRERSFLFEEEISLQNVEALSAKSAQTRDSLRLLLDGTRLDGNE